MSCGDPRDTDCREVLEQLWLLLDNECGHERRELLRHHLDDCGPCLEKYGLQEHLKALLARKCGGDHAPEAFKQRLLQSIQEIMISRGVVEVSSIEVSGSVETHVRLSTEC